MKERQNHSKMSKLLFLKPKNSPELKSYGKSGKIFPIKLREFHFPSIKTCHSSSSSPKTSLSQNTHYILFITKFFPFKKSENHSTWEIRFISCRNEKFFLFEGGKNLHLKSFSTRRKRFLCSNWQKTCMIYYVCEKCW